MSDGSDIPRSRQQESRRRPNAFVQLLKDLVFVIVGALIASTLLRVFVAQMFVIPSGSMETTLMVRDRVVVQKLIGYQRGDVIVFRDVNGWLAPAPTDSSLIHKGLVFIGLWPDESSNHLVKRLIGLPGDHVTCCDNSGRLSVNGVALDETAYLYKDANGRQAAPSDYPFDVVVPAGHVFVMGDHRNNSLDSRCHLDEKGLLGSALGDSAFVPTSAIVGSTVAVAFPFNRFKTMGVPAAFAGIPSASGSPPTQAVITGSPPAC